MEIVKPKTYGGPGGVEVKMVNAYEDSCVILSQHLSRDPKQMTVLEYRRAIRTLERQVQAQKEKRRNGKPH